MTIHNPQPVPPNEGSHILGVIGTLVSPETKEHSILSHRFACLDGSHDDAPWFLAIVFDNINKNFTS